MPFASEYVQIVVTTVLQIVMAVAGVVAIQLLTKWLKKLGIEIDNETMKEIEKIIDKAVAATNQMLTDKYKEANPNSKLTDEQQVEVFENTKKLIMQCLNSDQILAIVTKYGTNIDDALKMLIENSVFWNKKNATTQLIPIESA